MNTGRISKSGAAIAAIALAQSAAAARAGYSRCSTGDWSGLTTCVSGATVIDFTGGTPVSCSIVGNGGAVLS